MKNKFFLTGLIGLSLLSTANASVYTVEAGFSGENRGAFNSSLAVTSLNDRWKVQDGSYQVRSIGAFGQPIEITRNYHIFDIPTLAVNEVVTGVKLSLNHSGNSYDSPDATETFQLFDIDAANFAEIRAASVITDARDISILNTIYNDLGAGVNYGSFTSSVSDNNTLQTISTDDGDLLLSLVNALTTFGQAGGGDFGLGGSISSNTHTSGNTLERIFRGTSNLAAVSSLEITTTVVPVPAAAWLFGTALLGLAGTSTRRKSNLSA